MEINATYHLSRIRRSRVSWRMGKDMELVIDCFKIFEKKVKYEEKIKIL